MKPRSIRAWAVVAQNNKLNALEIYSDKDVVLSKGEKLVRVEISVVK